MIEQIEISCFVQSAAVVAGRINLLRTELVE